MFHPSRPPFLVQLISTDKASLFPPQEGYNTHYFSEDLALASFRDGWTFPLSARQQSHIAHPPLLLIKNAGGVTASGSTFDKGYAHQFCRTDGGEPDYLYCQEVFHNQRGINWMLVENGIVMIWFQYGYKNQFLGVSGHDFKRSYYGRLLIREFYIRSINAPRFDKYADRDDTVAKQYVTESVQLLNTGWTVDEQNPEATLTELLARENLERFTAPVQTALKRSSTANA